MSLTTKEQAGVLTSTVVSKATTSRKEKLQAPPQQASSSLPEEPLVTIEASKTSALINLRDVWAYRELLYFLVWRDLKVRYKQTVIGAVWVIIQPLLTTLIFTIFLGMLARVPSDGIPYPVFAYAGLLPWTFFANAVATSGNSIVGNAGLITKVYFPRMIIPSAAIGARLVDFAVAFATLIGLMVYYRVPVTWGILMLPVLVLLITLLALGVGMWVSALNVKFRDVSVAIPVLIQLLMFASPIIYPSSLVPAQWRWVYALNPITGIIEGFRASLFGLGFDWLSLAISTAFTLTLLVYSMYAFRRMESSFADVV